MSPLSRFPLSLGLVVAVFIAGTVGYIVVEGLCSAASRRSTG